MGLNLLSIKGNAKTRKNISYISAELSLAPSITSGYNTCPFSSEGCQSVCIGWFSGRNVMNPVKQAKIRKTKLFFEQREIFLMQLIDDLYYLVRKSRRDNLPICVRLNCYSDISWENIKIGDKNLFELFPEIQFYDYTKNPNRFKSIPENYHLTFSRSENNDKSVNKIINSGFNVAIVFDKLPKVYKGNKVIDGDIHDMRFLDTENVIVGLKPKGKGIKDNSNFVIRTTKDINK